MKAIKRNQGNAMKRQIAILGTMMLLVSSCEFTSYTIKLKPKGHELQRSLTVEQHSRKHAKYDSTRKPATLPAEEVTRIAKIYGVKPPAKAISKFTVEKTFKGRTPDDVGGAGYYKRFDTKMGSATIYSERFRGRDDLYAQIQARSKSAERLVFLITGWLQSELKDDPHWKKLQAFLNGPFRRDIHNLSVYSWSSQIRPRGQTATQPAGGDDEEFFMRVAQYLGERDYLAPEDIPAWTRAVLMMSQKDNRTPLWKLLQKLIARKMAVPKGQAAPKSLAFLDSSESAEKSLREYLRKTPDYKARLAEWENRKDKTPEDKPPDPMNVFAPHNLFAFSPPGIPGNELLEVSLSLPGKPFRTNGFWNEKDKQVKWKYGMPSRGELPDGLPIVCYAIWAEPNRRFQTRHFGKVALTEKDLMRYCLWRKSLTEKEAKEWDSFVAGLKPGEKLLTDLEKFRFSHEPTAPLPGEEKPPKSFAAGVTEHLIHILEPKDKDKEKGKK